MANIIKIQNHLAKRERTKEKKRTIETKEVRVYFLIVCEGEKTEPNYFKSFKTNVKSYVYTIDAFGEASNTRDLVKRTIKARDKSSQKYDSVWVVFDKDSFSPNNFNGAIELAENNNIKAGWSNEAFELWYLLHFQYRNTHMSRNEYKSAIEVEVNAKISAQSKSKKAKAFVYKKNSAEMYSILEKYGDQKQAIKNAEKLILTHNCNNFAIHNPCTRIHLLVQELNGDSEELNKQIKLKSE
ncbi:RloB family protein [Flavobacterium aquicola]|uniref:RloB-like protein n=1 Tax=Flavobacterium aquicola TaxID=1682742 RepID=A0A3E0EJN9_9FLAO|nr:RloB family protein [Flavobacterium aquicola]REG98452.1 RloB-like protein [Flavobacterium aquicola]